MVRFAMTAAALCCLWAAPSRADEAGDIRKVIAGQIAAFGSGDLQTAYSFASPDIQRIFPSPGIFGDMVRLGYPMIWRPGGVVYFGLRDEDGRKVQRMGFRDSAGDMHLFDYEMMPGPSGWRIDGVLPVRGDAAV